MTSTCNSLKKSKVPSPTAIKNRVYELESELIDIRRWLHQHPELSWQEYESTKFIVDYLEALGLEVFQFDGHTGCWTVIHGDKKDSGNRTILLRADYDALPIQEDTGLPFASIHEGVFHGCGHETHAAMLLLATKILVEYRSTFSGSVKILFQAAEETANGAQYYVDQGIMDDVDAVFGCHTLSAIAPFNGPRISVNPGPRTAGTDEFHIHIQGMGCHGGMPHQGNDAIVAASSIVMHLQTIVSRMTNPLDTLVITVGTLNAGTNYNVVADTATLTGTVRTYSKEVQESVAEKIRKVIEDTASALGCTATLEYITKTGPVIHTDPEMLQISHDAVVKLFGEEGLWDAPPMGGGDDFAYFIDKAPGVYAFLAASLPDDKGIVYPHHHPKVIFDEAALPWGAALHVQVAIDFLNKSRQES